jgi:hypothetical protein
MSVHPMTHVAKQLFTLVRGLQPSFVPVYTFLLRWPGELLPNGNLAPRIEQKFKRFCSIWSEKLDHSGRGKFVLSGQTASWVTESGLSLMPSWL